MATDRNHRPIHCGRLAIFLGSIPERAAQLSWPQREELIHAISLAVRDIVRGSRAPLGEAPKSEISASPDLMRIGLTRTDYIAVANGNLVVVVIGEYIHFDFFDNSDLPPDHDPTSPTHPRKSWNFSAAADFVSAVDRMIQHDLLDGRTVNIASAGLNAPRFIGKNTGRIQELGRKPNLTMKYVIFALPAECILLLVDNSTSNVGDAPRQLIADNNGLPGIGTITIGITFDDGSGQVGSFGELVEQSVQNPQLRTWVSGVGDDALNSGNESAVCGAGAPDHLNRNAGAMFANVTNSGPASVIPFGLLSTDVMRRCDNGVAAGANALNISRLLFVDAPQTTNNGSVVGREFAMDTGSVDPAGSIAIGAPSGGVALTNGADGLVDATLTANGTVERIAFPMEVTGSSSAAAMVWLQFAGPSSPDDAWLPFTLNGGYSTKANGAVI
jgi:hypothetical protein